jgi:hypothetical protein
MLEARQRRKKKRKCIDFRQSSVENLRLLCKSGGKDNENRESTRSAVSLPWSSLVVLFTQLSAVPPSWRRFLAQTEISTPNLGRPLSIKEALCAPYSARKV